MTDKGRAFEQARREWVDGSYSLTTRFGRTEHPEWQATPVTWCVTLRDERDGGGRVAIDSGWSPRLIDAACEAADARQLMRARFQRGEFEDRSGDEPF